jgi:small subunit ribosomal protein S16
MLKIRLQRTGRKNVAQFRVVLTDSKNAAKSGKFKEVLGSYDPHASTFTVKVDRVKELIADGAQPSETVFNFLVDKGVIEGKKKNVLSKKAPTTKRKDAKKK